MTEESAPNIMHMQYDAMQTQLGLAPKDKCRACISRRSTNTSGRRYAAAAAGPAGAGSISLTYHHPCSSSTRLMLDSSSVSLTSSKRRIVGSGRICGSTSCYLKLDQCRLGLLVVYMWFSVQCSSEQLGTPNNYFIIFSSETKNCLLY